MRRCGRAPSRGPTLTETSVPVPRGLGATKLTLPLTQADLTGISFDSFKVPPCEQCGEIVRSPLSRLAGLTP